MIIRMWSGKVRSEDADAYHQYLRQTGLKDYQATPGNSGAQVLRRIEGDVTEFLLVTRWESDEAIRAFAGDDIEKGPMYYPEDAKYLLEMTPHVRHYEELP